jgi:hypothetical protein
VIRHPAPTKSRPARSRPSLRCPGPAYDVDVNDRPADVPAERIAAAVERLRARDVAVSESVQGSAIRYEATRPAYHLVVYVDPPRFIGLEFDLLAADGSVRLHYFIDTDLYDISQPRHAWFASAIATDIVLLLDALTDGGLLAKLDRRRASMIVPTGQGPRIVKRGRVWTSAGRYHRDRVTAIRDGFEPVPR